MARIRTIKPEFWTAEQVMECSPMSRLLFIGMWNFCDDRGVHPAAIKTIKAEVFPGDDITTSDVSAWIAELICHGLLAEFESDSRRWWHVTGWHHQLINRPTPSRYPEPPRKAPLPSAAGDGPHCSEWVADHTEETPIQPPISIRNRPILAIDPPQAQFTYGGLTEDSLSAHGGLTEDSLSAHGGLIEDSLSAHGGLTTGKERKGKEGNGSGTEEKKAPSAPKKSRAEPNRKFGEADMPQLSPTVARDLLAHRSAKRSPMTATAWRTMLTEFAKAGLAPDDGVAMMLQRGWQGFQADWVHNDNRRPRHAGTGHNGYDGHGFAETKDQQRERIWREINEPYLPNQ